MNEAKKEQIAKLAVNVQEKRIQYDSLSMRNKLNDPDEQKKLYAEYTVAHAELLEAEYLLERAKDPKLVDMNEQITPESKNGQLDLVPMQYVFDKLTSSGLANKYGIKNLLLGDHVEFDMYELQWLISTVVATELGALRGQVAVMEATHTYQSDLKKLDSAVHAAVLLVLDETSVRNEVLRGMCIEVAMEKARNVFEA